MPEKAREIVDQLLAAGINSRLDAQHAIGRRYRRHDEAGTPFCLTVDGQTMEDGTITIRDRDTMAQERIPVADAVTRVRERVWA
ncbi:MAG: His/Gly/Thr/Pro-type tRNA ligase C-terminal domain-containing protein, partial [Myxococcota bacterium]|jgi:glycyl-tRNA synthetase|nr:His/Gly/Thr/Pro-type tRNA ligase C-terminal domain-containing protein [Myxococcota bacterium]